MEPTCPCTVLTRLRLQAGDSTNVLSVEAGVLQRVRDAGARKLKEGEHKARLSKRKQMMALCESYCRD